MPKRNLAWILVIAMITLLMWQLPQTIAGRDAVYKAFGPLADVKAQIHRRFVDDLDDARLTDAAVEAGIKAMVQELHDPYAGYLNPDEYSRFKNRTDGFFGGIGVEVWANARGLEVISREPRSPADEADILPGDIITHIGEQSTADLPLVEAVNHLLNGPPGTELTLTVIRPSANDQERVLTLARAIIQLNPVRGWSRAAEGGWRYMIDPVTRIGYVRLNKFTHDAPQKLDVAVQRLIGAGLRGLILDLRENTGGLLDAARDVADRFLESGTIVRIAGRRADGKKWSAMHDGTYPAMPMCVLINGASASAAEIVAGALRDHHRAEIVGERSYGKGSVQEVVELDGDNGAIKLTTAYYYLPSGQCINRGTGDKWGVDPTIPVPLSEAQRTKWQATWREIEREPGASPESDAQAVDPAEESVSDPHRAAAERRLLDGDVQLRVALKHLQDKLRTPGEDDEDPQAASSAASN